MKQPRSTTWTWIWMRGSHRSAIQFSMSPKLAIGGLILLLCLIAALIIGLVIYQANMRQLQENSISLRAQLLQQDQDIAVMQANLDSINERSSGLLDQIQKVTQLESQLKQVIQSSSSSAVKFNQISGDKTALQPSKVSVPSDRIIPHTQVGGEYVPLLPDSTSLPDRPTPEETKRNLDTIDHTLERWDSEIPKLLAQAEQAKKLIDATPTFWPTTSARITSSFGGRTDPFHSNKAQHNGIDIGGERGDPILASATGVVIEQGYDAAKGNYIIIRHSDQFTTRYLHLSQIDVTEGQNVQKGEQIGLLGSTGRSTGPHLHFEIHSNNDPIDPMHILIEP